MRVRLLLFLALTSFASICLAKDVYLSVGGSVNNFRTDARIFNPSASKDIQIQAYFLPGSGASASNAGVQPVTISVPKRQMVVYDDVVGSLFHASGVGAVRLTSADDFVATQRIYAQVVGGTLGQFVPGFDVATAKKAGVIIQLKSSPAFRTNLGAVNPNPDPATVTWRLYDKNNALIGQPKVDTMAPYSVISPLNMVGYLNGGAADLSDAWVSFTSTQPLFAYGSVVDSGTSDPTFVPMSEDTGAPPPSEVTPSAKTVDVKLQSFAIVVQSFTATVGDQITFHVHTADATHGFTLVDPSGAVLIPSMFLSASDAAVDKTITITKAGRYSYFCTLTTCGTGHLSMSGSFVVGADDDPGHGY
ncbi:MAG: hypothetical protein ABI837_01305 [Acidobacteriota bacterium]